MRAADVEARRAAILRLAAQGARVRQIARQLGCAPSVVSRTLAAGTATDRRTTWVHPPRIAPAVVTTVATLAAEGRSARDIRDLVRAEHGPGAISNLETIHRLARPHRPPPPRGPTLLAEDLAAAEAADPRSPAPEIALLRSLIRSLTAQIASPRQTGRGRAPLLHLLPALVNHLARLHRRAGATLAPVDDDAGIAYLASPATPTASALAPFVDPGPLADEIDLLRALIRSVAREVAARPPPDRARAGMLRELLALLLTLARVQAANGSSPS